MRSEGRPAELTPLLAPAPPPPLRAPRTLPLAVDPRLWRLLDWL
jgi:hypothetical protein